MRSRTKRSGSEPNKTDQPPAAAPETAERRETVIRASLQFVGDIRSTGSVTIAGRVKGEVAARSLTVVRGGAVEGHAVAETARIDGLLEGDLEAGAVILGPNARVLGDITHQSLAMEPGAQFEGRAVLSPAATPSEAGKPDKPARPEAQPEAAPEAAAETPAIRPH